MELHKSRWNKLGAIVVGRQSNVSKGTASTDAQLEHIGLKVIEEGMRVVDEIPLQGVSAVSPARITEILQKLFERKKVKNDFEVIAWQIEDRATRGGGEFGMWLEHEAKRHGLQVYFADSDMSDTPYGPVVRVAKYEAAKEESVGKGRRCTQGQDLAKKNGFYRTAGPTPIGCDRIYCGADHKRKFTLRNLGNGLQEQVDFETKLVIGRYGTIGKKSQNRFKKQANEYSLLVPGDRKAQRLVRVIFFLRYKRGWRGCKIADYLNRLKVPAPKGGEWSPRQVYIIYENEAYTGVTFNNQTYSGRFFRRDKLMGFVAINRDACEMVLKKTFSPKMRPMDDWDRIDQPYMYNFLTRDVRDLAIAAQAELAAHRLDPTRPKRKSNAHPASNYLFSGKLVAKQDSVALTGTLSGDDIEYYRHPKDRKGRRKNSIFNRLISAKPLHEAAVRLLADILLDQTELRPRLTQYVIEQRQTTDSDTPRVAELLKERDDLKKSIQSTIRSLAGAALADVQDELERMGNRRNEIEAKLTQVQNAQQTDFRPVEQVVEEALAVLAEESQRLLTLSAEPLRDAVNRLIPNLYVNMETKEVEMTVALPVWATTPKRKPRNRLKSKETAVGATTNSWSSTGSCTQIMFLVATCQYEWARGSHDRPPCYRCQRKAA